MPPAKARPHDPDARSDAPTKDKHSAASHTSHARGRRTGGPAHLTNGSHLKEVLSAAADATNAANRNGGQTAHTGSTGGVSFALLPPALPIPPKSSLLTHPRCIAQISWVSEDLSLLQDYRSSHRLEAPSAFKNPLGHAILGRGIGKYSPTMVRKKNERRISKEQLATAVRKNFNALAVSESEVIVDLLYKVKMQGTCPWHSARLAQKTRRTSSNDTHQTKRSACDSLPHARGSLIRPTRYTARPLATFETHSAPRNWAMHLA